MTSGARTLAIVGLVACGGPAKLSPVAATEQRAPATVGTVVAVEQIGDATIVLDETRAFVLRGGALSAVTEAPHGWRAGAAVAAPDGEGRWALGIDRDGRVWRISIAGELEDVTDRFVLGRARVDAIAGAAATSAFALGDGIAVSADGIHLDRTKRATPLAVAAGRGRIAMLDALGVEVWDLARGTTVTYPIPQARTIAFVDDAGAMPRLAVATDRLLYVEDGTALRRIVAPGAIAAIAAAGTRLWVLADGLYALDGGSLHRADVRVPANPRLFGAPTGDVWVASTGVLTRATIDRVVDDPLWRAQVAPVFQRVCSHCHLPGGEAGVDLSTPAAWQAARGELARRVLVTRTMPPAGTELSDDDRRALAGWLEAR